MSLPVSVIMYDGRLCVVYFFGSVFSLWLSRENWMQLRTALSILFVLYEFPQLFVKKSFHCYSTIGF